MSTTLTALSHGGFAMPLHFDCLATFLASSGAIATYALCIVCVFLIAPAATTGATLIRGGLLL